MNAHITGSELKGIGEGEPIELGGKIYHLTMDFNAICDIEEKYGSLEEGMDAIGGGHMKDIRFLLAALLRHSDDNVTERQAGKLITISNMQQIMDALGKAMQMQAGPDGGEEKKEVSPQET